MIFFHDDSFETATYCNLSLITHLSIQHDDDETYSLWAYIGQGPYIRLYNAETPEELEAWFAALVEASGGTLVSHQDVGMALAKEGANG